MERNGGRREGKGWSGVERGREGGRRKRRRRGEKRGKQLNLSRLLKHKFSKMKATGALSDPHMRKRKGEERHT